MSGTLERAIRLREAGEVEEARDLLLKLLARNPEDPAANDQCAWVHDRIGSKREAIPLHRRAIERGLPSGDLEGAILSLGSSYRVVGNRARAAEVMREGVAWFPQNRAMQAFPAHWPSTTSTSATGPWGSPAPQPRRDQLRPGDHRLQRSNVLFFFYANRLDEPHSPR